MALGIYKQGQGYWVRVMTAALIAVATLGAAGWMAGQAQRFETTLPRSTWAVTLDTARGPLAPGEQVELFGGERAGPAGTGQRLGSARVLEYDATNKNLRITGAAMDAATSDPTMTTSITGAAFTARVERTKGEPPIEPKLLSGLVVGVVLLLGAGLAYYLVGVRPGSSDFLIATDMEMKKVNWSSPREIRGSTLVVIGASVIIAGFLFGVDLVFQWFFRLIGILVDAG